MRRIVLVALPCAWLCFAACAESPPPTPTAPMPPPGVASAPTREASPVDGEMLGIARAEEDIDRALGQMAPAPSARGPRGRAEDDVRGGVAAEKAAPTDGRRRTEADKDEKAANAKQDQVQGGHAGGGNGGGGEACAVACKALASMTASAQRLCQLAGENDARCDDATARVHGAAARVKSACPMCTVSTAPAPPPPPSPAKAVPAGPAPGMPGSSSSPIP